MSDFSVEIHQQMFGEDEFSNCWGGRGPHITTLSADDEEHEQCYPTVLMTGWIDERIHRWLTSRMTVAMDGRRDGWHCNLVQYMYLEDFHRINFHYPAWKVVKHYINLHGRIKSTMVTVRFCSVRYSAPPTLDHDTLTAQPTKGTHNWRLANSIAFRTAYCFLVNLLLISLMK